MGAPSQETAQPWCDEADVVMVAGAEAVAALPAGLLDRTIQYASGVLYDFTRRRWPGATTETVRPCGMGPAQWAGCQLVAFGAPCSCGRPHGWELRLSGHPVVAIEQVKVDGEVLATDAYQVRDWEWLARLDGFVWPCCQNLRLPDTELGTMSVRYQWGVLPPDAGVLACAALAYHLALALSPDPDGACKLPERVQTITRQGVSMAIIDPLTLFADGLTGLAEVDLWVASVNRGNERRNGAVIVPELAHRPVRRLGT